MAPGYPLFFAIRVGVPTRSTAPKTPDESSFARVDHQIFASFLDITTQQAERQADDKRRRANRGYSNPYRPGDEDVGGHFPYRCYSPKPAAGP